LLISIKAFISGISHELAHRGCSWRKYLPEAICSKYNSMTNLMWRGAATLARCMAVGSALRASFRACQVENALHAGDPINMYGFWLR